MLSIRVAALVSHLDSLWPERYRLEPLFIQRYYGQLLQSIYIGIIKQKYCECDHEPVTRDQNYARDP